MRTFKVTQSLFNRAIDVKIGLNNTNDKSWLCSFIDSSYELDTAALHPLGSQCSISVWPPLALKTLLCNMMLWYSLDVARLSLSMQTGWLHWRNGFWEQGIRPSVKYRYDLIEMKYNTSIQAVLPLIHHAANGNPFSEQYSWAWTISSKVCVTSHFQVDTRFETFVLSCTHKCLPPVLL